MLKIAFIGMGGMGKHHARTIKNSGKAEIVGVSDLIEEKAKEAAKEVKTRAYKNYKRMLNKEINGLVICTPPFARTDVVVNCAKEGYDMFVEKPIALNLKDADKMVNAVEKYGVKMMMGYVLRFTHPFSTIRNIYATGEIGSLVSVWTRRFMPWNPVGIWYGDQSKSGGITVDFATHDIDWLRWVGGDVSSVYGRVKRVYENITADDDVWAMMNFKEGIGIMGDSWSAALSDNSQGIIGTKGAIIVDGNKVRMKLHGGEEKEINTPEGGETIQEHYLKCLEKNEIPIVTGLDGRQALAVSLGIQQSTISGKVVNLK